MARSYRRRSRSLAQSKQEEKRIILSKVLKTTKDIKKATRAVKVSRATAYRCKRSLKVRRTVRRKKGSGRPSVLDKGKKILINNLIRENPFLSCQDLKDKSGIQASIETIRRYLVDTGFTRRRPHQKLALNENHIERRFEWALEHRNFLYSPEIIFTDECSIWLHDNNHEGWFHKKHDHQLLVDKHAGKIHCWAGINMLEGKIGFWTFQGNMNAERYVEILREMLVPQSDYYFPGGYFLMQDNDPKHKSHLAMKFIEENVPGLLEWPSKSPDLNPLENIWAILKQNVRKRLPETLEDLENVICDEWDKLDDEMIKRTCESFNNRVQECYERRGAQTHY